MATTTQHQQAHIGAARLTTEQVWRQLAKAAFADVIDVTAVR